MPNLQLVKEAVQSPTSYKISNRYLQKGKEEQQILTLLTAKCSLQGFIEILVWKPTRTAVRVASVSVRTTTISYSVRIYARGIDTQRNALAEPQSLLVQAQYDKDKSHGDSRHCSS